VVDSGANSTILNQAVVARDIDVQLDIDAEQPNLLELQPSHGPTGQLMRVDIVEKVNSITINRNMMLSVIANRPSTIVSNFSSHTDALIESTLAPIVIVRCMNMGPAKEPIIIVVMTYLHHASRRFMVIEIMIPHHIIFRRDATGGWAVYASASCGRVSWALDRIMTANDVKRRTKSMP
jgi:hypothetical protein